MSQRPQHPNDFPPPTPATAPVDRMLNRVGDGYRRQANGRSLSPQAAERIQRSLLAAAKPPEAASVGVSPFAQWLRTLSRPLAYGFMGAAAVLVWSLWIHPARNPDAQLLYVGGMDAQFMETNLRTLKQGQTLIAQGAPGAVLQVGEHSQIFMRTDTAIELVSDKILALKTGEVWVYHTGKSGNLTILTPQGRVTPIGTVFGVRSGLPSAGGLRVEVLEGVVSVNRDETVVEVASGRQLEWNFSSPTAMITEAPVAVPTWTEALIDAYRGEFFKRYFPSMEPRRGY